MSFKNWFDDLIALVTGNSKIADGVYFDPALGESGTDWPIGSAQRPSNDFLSVLAMCVARKTPKIYIYNFLMPTVDTPNMTFVDAMGFPSYFNDYPTIYSSKVIAGSSFRGINLWLYPGGTNVTISCDKCGVFFTGGEASGYFKDSLIGATDIVGGTPIIVIDGQDTIFRDCAYHNVAGGNIIGITAVNPNTVTFDGADADFELGGLNSGTVTFNMTGGSVTIKATCVGGTIIIRGDCKITNLSALPIIVEYSPSMLDAIYYSASGSPGTTDNNGLPQSPSNNWLDIFTMAAARSIKKIVLLSDATPTGATGSIVDGTGTLGTSPTALVAGVNLVPVSVAGTFTVTLPVGVSGKAETDGWVVAGSPAALVAGANTITVNAGGAGNIKITIWLNFSGFEVEGIHDGINLTLNSQAWGDAIVRGCKVTGAQNGDISTWLYMYDCGLYAIINANFYSHGGFSDGATILIADGGYLVFDGLSGGVLLLDFAGITASAVDIYNNAAQFNISNITFVPNFVRAECISGTSITSLGTNTSGTIIVSGDAHFTKGGGGATETDSTIYAPIAQIEAEVESTSLSAAGGSVANNTRLGKLARWIADALNRFSSAADGGTHVYPDSVASKSQLSYQMVKGTPPVITTFDNTKHSQQAIGDNILDATNGLVALSNRLQRINNLCAQPAVYTATVTIPAIGSAADQALGTLTIAGLPAGAVPSHLFVNFLFTERNNTSANANALSGAQNLQVKRNAEALRTFFSFAGGEYSTVASSPGSGDAKRGTVDLISLITPANGNTLTFQWTAAGATGASLVLAGFQIVVEIWYTLGT